MSTALTPAQLHRLRWRSRRGLLESDLLIERFFARHASALTQTQAQAFSELMQLDDTTLLDILLRRTALPHSMNTAPMCAVLEMLRPPEKIPIHQTNRKLAYENRRP